MVAEFGSPTFFLTFSCAEYSSEDIREYLHKVNTVPPSYNTGKLCTEDPVSVSRQFSLKFNEMFNRVLIKGQILGPVREFYSKKEYQARGAPHYHCLIWIDNAPVVGESRSEDVTRFIDERITCNIQIPAQSYTKLLRGTSYTSAAITVRKRENLVKTYLLQSANLDFLAQFPKKRY